MLNLTNQDFYLVSSISVGRNLSLNRQTCYINEQSKETAIYDLNNKLVNIFFTRFTIILYLHILCPNYDHFNYHTYNLNLSQKSAYIGNK